MEGNNIFILNERIDRAPNVITIRFLPTEAMPAFIPGQFVNIYFLDDRCGGQGKPYSISSSPKDAFVDITVKKIGKFSSALHDLKIGEQVAMSAPEGYFYPEDRSEDIVFLAGGIGIAPFYSIISDLFEKKQKRDVFLFYSNKTRNDISFSAELNALEKKWDRLKIIYVLTRQPAPFVGCESKRIDADMIKKYARALDGKYYFICGSIGFVKDLWKELKKSGVKNENIKLESLY